MKKLLLISCMMSCSMTYAADADGSGPKVSDKTSAYKLLERADADGSGAKPKACTSLAPPKPQGCRVSVSTFLNQLFNSTKDKN